MFRLYLQKVCSVKPVKFCWSVNNDNRRVIKGSTHPLGMTPCCCVVSNNRAVFDTKSCRHISKCVLCYTLVLGRSADTNALCTMRNRTTSCNS